MVILSTIQTKLSSVIKGTLFKKRPAPNKDTLLDVVDPGPDELVGDPVRKQFPLDALDRPTGS